MNQADPEARGDGYLNAIEVSQRRIDLVPPEVRRMVAFLRAWCLVEVMAAVRSERPVAMKLGAMDRAGAYPQGVHPMHTCYGVSSKEMSRGCSCKNTMIKGPRFVNADADSICHAAYERLPPEARGAYTRVEPTVFSTISSDGCRAFVGGDYRHIAQCLAGLIDVERAEATVPADLQQILAEVRAAPGGADALNQAVVSMIVGAISCASEPLVQARGLGDPRALPLDGATKAELSAWAVAAAGSGYTGLLGELLERGADATAESSQRPSACEVAAFAGRVEALRLCLTHAPGGAAAAVNRRFTFFRRGCLHSAAMNGHVEATRLLLDLGAHVDLESHDQPDFPFPWTPLLSALLGGHVAEVQLLVERGARKPNRQVLGWALGFCGASDERKAQLHALLR